MMNSDAELKPNCVELGELLSQFGFFSCFHVIILFVYLRRWSVEETGLKLQKLENRCFKGSVQFKFIQHDESCDFG